MIKLDKITKHNDKALFILFNITNNKLNNSTRRIVDFKSNVV